MAIPTQQVKTSFVLEGRDEASAKIKGVGDSLKTAVPGSRMRPSAATRVARINVAFGRRAKTKVVEPAFVR